MGRSRTERVRSIEKNWGSKERQKSEVEVSTSEKVVEVVLPVSTVIVVALVVERLKSMNEALPGTSW